MEDIFNRLPLMALPFTLLFFILYSHVSAYEYSYFKYVRNEEALQLECLSDFNNSIWTILWLRTPTHSRTDGEVLSKNGELYSQNTDRRFSLKVHNITAERKRYLLNMDKVDEERDDATTYYCVAVMRNIDTTNIAEINKQGTDLTGNIFVTVNYVPDPAEPTCLKEPTANNQVTLLCCHGYARPFLTRQWKLNGTVLKKTKQIQRGYNNFCLAVNVSSADEKTYWCELTSEAYLYFNPSCEINLAMTINMTEPNPSPTPTIRPSPTPTMCPSPTPTVCPTPKPTICPSSTPTIYPSTMPTACPTPTPTICPSPTPNIIPSPATPTIGPSPTPNAAQKNNRRAICLGTSFCVTVVIIVIFILCYRKRNQKTQKYIVTNPPLSTIKTYTD